MKTNPEPAVSIDDIRDAAAALEGHIERTPFRHSITLSQITGAEVWIKFENLQFTASFKERGALNKLRGLSREERARGVVAMSAGNHAQGVARHAARLKTPATIVMPEDSPFVKIEHTRNLGARVVLHGRDLAAADDYAHELCREENMTFIHPYDDPAVIAGQGTVALEMIEDVPDIEMLAIPVGGGGLISGMATAGKAIKPELTVVGVQARMFPWLYAHANGQEMMSGGATIAEGIAVSKRGAISTEICERLVDRILLVDEDHLERAITLLAMVEKTVAEGAGAAGIAALLAHPGQFQGRRVGLVLCGGNIDARLLASVLTRSLVREQRLASVRVVGGDRPGTLAEVSRVIGEGGGNIIEVAHNRIQLDVPAKGAEFDILIETRDAQHTRDIRARLDAAGYTQRPD